MFRLNPLETTINLDNHRNTKLYALFEELRGEYGGLKPAQFDVATYIFKQENRYRDPWEMRIVGRWTTNSLSPEQVQELEQLYGELNSSHNIEGARRVDDTRSPIVDYKPLRGGGDNRRRGYLISTFPRYVTRTKDGIWVTRDFDSPKTAKEAAKKSPVRWFYGEGKHTVELREDRLTAVEFMELGLQISHILKYGDRIPRDKLLYDVYRRLNLLDVDQKTRDQIAGLDGILDEILWRVFAAAKNPELAERFGYKSESVLLVGVPGTGKTLLGEVLMGIEADTIFVPIDAWGLVIAQTGSGLFDSVKKLREEVGLRTVLYVDDIESALLDPEQSSVAKEYLASSSKLLNIMRGMTQSSDVAIIGSTNNPWQIDRRFLEFGRFGRMVYVPRPDEKTRKGVIDINLRGKNVSEAVDPDRLTAETEGWTGRHLQQLCSDAGLFAVMRATGKDFGNLRGLTQEDIEGIEINPEDFEDGLRATGENLDLGRITEWDTNIQKYVAELNRSNGKVGFAAYREEGEKC